MASSQTPRRSRPQPEAVREAKAADAWQGFYHGSGREAIASLFLEFGLYTPMPGNDPNAAVRRAGQQDVLLRIVQLIGRKPGAFPADAVEDEDIVYQMMRV